MRALITGLGMISSVGRDVASSAAAVRAGLSAPSDLDSYQVLGGEPGEGVPVRGHPIRDYTEGFQFFGRWLRIATGCLRDLRAHAPFAEPWDQAFWRTTGLALALPVLDVQRFELDAPMAEPEVVARYATPLLSMAELPIRPTSVQIFPFGHAATAAAVQAGTAALAAGHLERVIVVAVDSYVDDASLGWLLEHGRVKQKENPVGMMPGELGACFVLEADASAARRGAPALAVVGGAATAVEPNHRFSGELSLGVALSKAMAGVLPEGALFTGDCYDDLNGEEWRARELGGALARLGARFAPAKQHHPAASLGDTGAASAAAAICVATRAFQRAAGAPSAIVISSAEHGNVASIALAKS